MKDQEEGVKFELKYILPDGASAQQAMAIEKIMDEVPVCLFYPLVPIFL